VARQWGLKREKFQVLKNSLYFQMFPQAEPQSGQASETIKRLTFAPKKNSMKLFVGPKAFSIQALPGFRG